MASLFTRIPTTRQRFEDLKQLEEHVRVPEDGKRPTLSAFEYVAGNWCTPK